MKPTSIPIGTRFGKWTVIGEVIIVRRPRYKYPVFPCRCVCGLEICVSSLSLRNGRSKGCISCYKNRCELLYKNKRYGLWTILEKVRNQHDKVLVRCACGREYKRQASTIIHGLSKGCVKCNAKKNGDRYRRKVTVGEKVKGKTVLADLKNGKVLVNCNCGRDYEISISHFFSPSRKMTSYCRWCRRHQIGAEIIRDQNGKKERFIKTSHQRNWKRLADVVLERYGMKRTRGDWIKFVNGNHLDVSISNLILVPKFRSALVRCQTCGAIIVNKFSEDRKFCSMECRNVCYRQHIDVINIKKQAGNGESQTSLAKRYKTSRRTVSLILKGGLK